jgi:hypothetical protein
VVAAADCVGRYANGDDEYQVSAHGDGRLSLALDGEVFARLVLVDDLTFSLQDPVSGQRMTMGRFHRESASGVIDGILIAGRFARRRTPRIPHARERVRDVARVDHPQLDPSNS